VKILGKDSMLEWSENSGILFRKIILFLSFVGIGRPFSACMGVGHRTFGALDFTRTDDELS